MSYVQSTITVNKAIGGIINQGQPKSVGGIISQGQSKSVGGIMAAQSNRRNNKTRRIIGGSCQMYYFCRNKTRLLPRQNTSFVATKVCLFRQNYVVVKIFCRDKHNFFATKVLSRQAYFCCNNTTFVATKMILVAVPANDRGQPKSTGRMTIRGTHPTG